MILDGPLGKAKYNTMCIEFQEKVSSQIYSFKWIFNAPNIKNECALIEFIEKTKVKLAYHLSNFKFLE